MQVRVCPECGEEFRADIVSCSDCGATLQDRRDDPDAAGEALPPPPPVPPPSRVPEDYRPVATASTADEIDPLARRLADAGLAFAVSGAVHRFELLVPADAVERALAVLGVAEISVEALGTCPACGTKVGGADECPECGLSLAVDADADQPGDGRD
jgi:tRNA(Ile2) C34 agmatinyltransferase TiaS